MRLQHYTVSTKLLLISLILILGGCAVAAKQVQKQWSEQYGATEPRTRVVNELKPDDINYWTDVKPILETRCVACHACYDAACQFKATAIEGIERGLSKEKVYEASRLKAATPGRLFEDAHTVEEWRKRGYFPALNEHENTPAYNREASLIYRALELKEENPLPRTKRLSNEEFTFGLGRSHSCPTPAEFDEFADKHPQWGMPYALPGLAPEEQAILKTWVENGAPYTARAPLEATFTSRIEKWESFLNQDLLKSRLAGRYIYEHLYLTHLYFPEVSDTTFFKLVRSTTAPGTDVNIIATRRPFDDPGVERVYYRIVPEHETVVDKTHNPYRLDNQRLARWQTLFIDAPYEVSRLPGYDMPDTANPFISFVEIPMNSRYRFMLEEAQSSIMNFIKGSVCRGQVAVNVIRDNFWVFFVDPDSPLSETVSTLLPTAQEELGLANSEGNNTFMPLRHWVEYAKLEKKRRRGRDEFMYQYFSQHPLDLELVWDGDGTNSNAALTVFRHLDSATIEKGLIGSPPQTVWLIDYTLLERIHYLLVAGYDVFGTLGHQLISRLHMDFLRMEGETNFLNFLPIKARDATRRQWYRDAPERTLEYLANPKFDEFVETGVEYTTDNPRLELIEKLRDKVNNAVSNKRSLDNIESDITRQALSRLATMTGVNTRLLPEMAIIRIENGDTAEHVTLLRNNAHINMTSIFNESKRMIPVENTVTVAYGFLGSYPNALMRIDESNINSFVDQVLAMTSASDYSAILDQFGIRRTNPDFWQYSDKFITAFKELDPVNAGVLDYNRLENR